MQWGRRRTDRLTASYTRQLFFFFFGDNSSLSLSQSRMSVRRCVRQSLSHSHTLHVCYCPLSVCVLSVSVSQSVCLSMSLFRLWLVCGGWHRTHFSDCLSDHEPKQPNKAQHVPEFSSMWRSESEITLWPDSWWTLWLPYNVYTLFSNTEWVGCARKSTTVINRAIFNFFLDPYYFDKPFDPMNCVWCMQLLITKMHLISLKSNS